MEEKPNYYAVIPAEVRYDKSLRANEKLLYGEITALAQKTGECWASNKYFADLYEVKPNAVATWIKHLKEKEYIIVDYEYEKGTKEIAKRILKIGGIQKDMTSYSKRYRGGIQKDEDNNTSINNTSIKENIKRKEYFENTNLNDLFYEFLEQRKKQKAVNSERAITLLLNKLNQFDDDTKKQMIEQSIENSWKGVFEIKQKKSKTIPKWFDKEQDIKVSSKQEEEEMKSILEELKK